MKSVMKPASKLLFSGVVVVFITWFSACATPAAAQGSPGQDAVYNSLGTVVGSSSFIDASQFINVNNNNICSAIYSILQHPTYSAAVIDARGISGTTALTCTAGTTPWNNGTTYLNKPSTILLPATGGSTPTPIIISTPWILPANTHLIGEGDGTSGGSTTGTTIQAASGFSGTMIQFGSSSPVCPSNVCTGISVENLTLDGQGPLGQTVSGIANAYSQDGSYVDHVSLYQILGTGLAVSGNANNSGPYSNITFDTGGSSGLLGTVCASINGLSGTHGIHGLSCNSETNDANAAVLLDSSNNSIEDVRIVGFYDGIRVGANANAQSNVLFNIIGDTNAAGGGSTPIIVVHIPPTAHTVSDLSIMGANNAGGNSGTITIKDELSGAQLTDTSVGIYALGELVNGGYSRYTTGPNAATWAVGSNSPTGSSCSRGSLYSCTGGAGGGCVYGSGHISYALWACALNGGTLGWVPIM